MAIKVGGTTVIDDSRAANVVSITGLTTALSVAQGGTGATSAGAARTALGLVIGTDVLSPTGSGAGLTGLSAGSLRSVAYTSSTSFTVPSGVTKIQADVIGGGGGTATASNVGAGGGGRAVGELSVTPGESLTINVGTGGAGGQSYGSTGQTGGTSSIVRSGTTLISATGGSGAGSNGNGSPGSGSSGSVYNVSGNFGIAIGPGSTGWGGSSGLGVPTYQGHQNGPGAGGYGFGNVGGSSGNTGQVTIHYVG
jgi:hypothetical protein